ncbi:MAG: ComEC/Rec2 family competence protein [Planctomycetota bacterium]
MGTPEPHHAPPEHAEAHTPARPQEVSRARRRAWSVFFALALGLVLGQHLPGVAVWVWAIACVLGLALHPPLRTLTGGGAGIIAVLAAALALGGAWAHHRLHTLPAGAPAALLEPTPPGETRLLGVRGVLDRDPRTTRPAPSSFDPPSLDEPVTRLDLRLKAIETDAGWIRARARIVVLARGDRALDLRAGDGVRTLGRFALPRPPANPGEPDWVLLARKNNSAGVLTTTPELIETDAGARDARGAWWRVRADVRAAASRMLGIDPRRATDLTAGQAVLLALVLGERTDELEPISTAFQRTGTAHLLAISGFHLGVLAAGVVLLIRAAGERGGWEAPLVALAILAILILVPVRPPIARAAFLLLALLGTESIGRRYDRLTLLAWIACALLIWRPMDVMSLGFQLSVGITALLLAMGDPAGRSARWLIAQTDAGRRFGASALATIRTYAACWGVGVPAIAYATSVFSPVAPIAALVLTLPVVAAVALGYLALAVSALSPLIGRPLAMLGAHLGGLSATLADWFDAVPLGSFQLPGVSLAWTIGASVLLIFAIASRRARWTPRALAVGAAGAWLALEVALAPALPAGVRARIDTLAVGDGTCHVIRSGRSAMLVDAGSLSPRIGERTVPDALRALGVHRVPTVLITHPNLDHYNALPELIGPLGVERVFTTRAFLNAPAPVPELLALLDAQGVEVVVLEAGDRIALGELQGEVLWPVGGAPARPLAANDTSLVVRFDVPTDAGVRTILTTGDIQRAAIGVLLERGLPRVDVLELPHHGSFTPEGVALVEATDPRVVHQSTGPARLLGDPWRSAASGRTWHATARDGAAWTEILHDGRVRTGSMRAGASTPPGRSAAQP